MAKFCRDLHNVQGLRTSFLLAAMVDLHADKLESLGKDDRVQREEELLQAKQVGVHWCGVLVDSSNMRSPPLQLCHSLATEHDTIRQEYWKYMDRDLTFRFGATQAN